MSRAEGSPEGEGGREIHCIKSLLASVPRICLPTSFYISIEGGPMWLLCASNDEQPAILLKFSEFGHPTFSCRLTLSLSHSLLTPSVRHFGSLIRNTFPTSVMSCQSIPPTPDSISHLHFPSQPEIVRRLEETPLPLNGCLLDGWYLLGRI